MATIDPLNDYTLGGANSGTISRDTTSASAAFMETDHEAWLYDDKGAGQIGDFEYRFKYTRTQQSSVLTISHPGAVSDTAGGTANDFRTNDDGFSVQAYSLGSTTSFLFNLHNHDADTTDIGGTGHDVDTIYYCIFERTGTTLKFTTYTGSYGGTEIQMLQLGGVTTATYRYHYLIASDDGASSSASHSFTIDDPEDNTVPPGGDQTRVCETGDFIVTFHDACLCGSLMCDTADFVVTGYDVTLTEVMELDCETMDIVVYDWEAALIVDPPALMCETMDLVLTMNDVSFSIDSVLQADTAAYVVTTYPADIDRGVSIIPQFIYHAGE